MSADFHAFPGPQVDVDQRRVYRAGELKAEAARKPMSNAEIAKRVKDEFKNLFEAGVEDELREFQE